MSITTMVIVVMDIYLQIVHHNSVTRMMDNSFEKVLISGTESDLETLLGLKIGHKTSDCSNMRPVQVH